MRHDHTIAVVIPVLNEVASIEQVIAAIPDWVDDIVVADNGSTDRTAALAEGAGARVVHEPRRGYGAACLRGIAHLDNPDIVVFLDGDLSDDPREMDRLVDPILRGAAELVIGSRVLGEREPGALSPQAAFGNWLATRLIRWIWGAAFTDLGPFRAIRYEVLYQLDMRDRDYGWTVEMQVKAAREAVAVVEAPVSYRRRIGRSKISGTLRGVVGAGTKILGTIFFAALFTRRTRRREAIAIFSRFPVPGAAKTRLITALGPEGAANLQRKMTEHTLCQAIPRSKGLHAEIRFAGGTQREMRAWLGAGYCFVPQGEGDLGARMCRTFEGLFKRGMERAVIIGTDCPDLDAAGVSEAFHRLRDADVVLGPASDGGYYLIGLRREAWPRASTALFTGIDWGNATVFSATRQVAEGLGLSVGILPESGDVDLPQDLPLWERAARRMRVSIVIPAINEEAHLGACIASARRGRDVEILVVDGGSTDATVAVGERLADRVLSGPRCRAAQLNLGAKEAAGGLLLFLHADTTLPEGFDTLVRRCLQDPGVALGAFSLGIDDQGLWPRVIAVGASLRSRCLGLPYGDQGLFLRKEAFQAYGGFPEQAILDDYALVCRARRAGKVVTVPATAITSARRWVRIGYLRTTLLNQGVLLGNAVGMSPGRLARWYRRGGSGAE